MKLVLIFVFSALINPICVCQDTYGTRFIDYNHLIKNQNQFRKILMHNDRHEFPYFLHYGDSIIQLRDVNFKRRGKVSVLSGIIIEYDTNYRQVYKLLGWLKNNVSYSEVSSEKAKYAGQTHLFVNNENSLPSNTVWLELGLDQFIGYHFFSVNSERKQQRLIASPAVASATVIGVGILIIGMLTYLFSQIW